MALIVYALVSLAASFPTSVFRRLEIASSLLSQPVCTPDERVPTIVAVGEPCTNIVEHHVNVTSASSLESFLNLSSLLAVGSLSENISYTQHCMGVSINGSVEKECFWAEFSENPTIDVTACFGGSDTEGQKAHACVSASFINDNSTDEPKMIVKEQDINIEFVFPPIETTSTTTTTESPSTTTTESPSTTEEMYRHVISVDVGAVQNTKMTLQSLKKNDHETVKVLEIKPMGNNKFEVIGVQEIEGLQACVLVESTKDDNARREICRPIEAGQVKLQLKRRCFKNCGQRY